MNVRGTSAERGRIAFTRWGFWGFVVGWTLLLGASFALSARGTARLTRETGETWARTAVHKDMSFRRWATMHGGSTSR